jgi:hypothetical protein
MITPKTAAIAAKMAGAFLVNPDSSAVAGAVGGAETLGGADCCA